MPSCNLSDFLVADGAQTLLFFPQVNEPVLPFEFCCHMNIKTLFKILFPGWVVGIGLCSYFRMPLNVDRRSREQLDPFHLFLFVLDEAGENPSI